MHDVKNKVTSTLQKYTLTTFVTLFAIVTLTASIVVERIPVTVALSLLFALCITIFYNKEKHTDATRRKDPLFLSDRDIKRQIQELEDFANWSHDSK